MKIKDAIVCLVMGLITGAILVIALFYYGRHSSELIFGNSTFFSRLMVWIICVISATVAESFANTSAREVLVDMVVAGIAVLMCINKHSINTYELLDSLKGVMFPVVITVAIAGIFSEPIAQWANKFVEKPMHKD